MTRLPLFFPLCFAAQNVDGSLSRETTFAFNERAKGLICCDIANAAERMFICWTVIGAVSLLFAIIVSIKVVVYHRGKGINNEGGNSMYMGGESDAVAIGSVELTSSNLASEGPSINENPFQDRYQSIKAAEMRRNGDLEAPLF